MPTRATMRTHFNKAGGVSSIFSVDFHKEDMSLAKLQGQSRRLGRLIEENNGSMWANTTVR